MDFNDLHPIDDMSHRYFIDPMFLEHGHLAKPQPDYTPRTGFVWPVTNPVLEEDKLKQKTAGATRLATQAPGTPTETEGPQLGGQPGGKTDALHGSTRKIQNTQLLMNSMFTASRHLEKNRTQPAPVPPAAAAQPSHPAPTPASTQGQPPVAPAAKSAPTPAPTGPPEPPAKGSRGPERRRRNGTLQNASTPAASHPTPAVGTPGPSHPTPGPS
ncbi:hypothetical protein BD626DRAFT_632633 [Schizophyllum amplum]|uniref:Uncharacterized protein n=1 Tax=Schizophyllum amplum TaxID=97359 RepID=A0A550C5Q4_9AGAR|nr:hypothetical protein BD626DRAFT_632633 [Auriculariopsis ampla]